MNVGLLNFENCTPQSALYRIFDIRRLLQMFATNSNTLVRPRLWDDPYENSILRAAGRQSRFSLYGQCWSLLPESDAMWRIYSPQKTGVRVQTTVAKLAATCDEYFSEEPAGAYFIGKVLYMDLEGLRSSMKEVELATQEHEVTKVEASTLLTKRREFQHEAEVRLIFRDSVSSGEDLHKYPLQPGELIESLQFDPRLAPEIADVYTHHFVERLGFPGSVSVSSLYAAPQWSARG